MSTIYKYRIRCTTDNKYEYVWAETEPTVCPTNTGHTIDSGTVTIVETRDSSIVKIQEESIETGGNFQCECRLITAATGPDVTTAADFTWPHPISALELQFVGEEQNRGDLLTTCVGPNTIIGALAANCPTGATGITVSQTVIDYTMVGYHLNLFNGVTTDNLGRVISIDSATNHILMENTPSRSYSAASPTYVRQTVYTVNNYTVGPPQRYVIGEGKIGGSYIPSGTIVRVEYTNKEASSKEITAQIEYLY